MLALHYKDFNGMYFGLNTEILKDPAKYISYIENTRGVMEDVFITLESTRCDRIDLGALGYKGGKWGHLVRTYLDMEKLKQFYRDCEASRGVSIAFDFNRKETGNGSCLREIILTREGRNKPWQRAKIIVRATETQKRMAADLILLHHVLANVPNLKLDGISYYITSAYISGMYVIPLIEPVFGLKIQDLDPAKHPLLKIIRYREEKYYQPDSPPQKLSPALIMQELHQAYKNKTPLTRVTVEDCSLQL